MTETKSQASVTRLFTRAERAHIAQLERELTEFAEEQCRLGLMRRCGVSPEGRTLYAYTEAGDAALSDDEVSAAIEEKAEGK